MTFIFLEFQQLFLMVSATLILSIACVKRKSLYNYLIAYCFLTLGVFFRSFVFLNESFNIMAYIGYAIAMIITFLAVLNDYYRIFIKTKTRTSGSLMKTMLLFQSLLLSIEIMILVLALISVILLTRIYFKQRSPTYAFIGLSIFAAFISLFFSTLYTIGLDWTYEFSEGIDNIMYSFMLVTGIVALLENKIRESEIKYKEAYETSEFYKDLIAHDTANILQNMSTSLDIASIYCQKTETQKEMNNLIKTMEEQIQRGKTLIYNVHTITDFKTGTFSKRKVDIQNIIGKLIEYIPENYSEKNINFELRVDEGPHLIKANDFLLNIFENILTNAIKHNDNEKIEINIKIQRIKKNQNNLIRTEFIDNGRGIRDQIKEEIFSKEYTSTNLLRRTSLGLYLVKRIVESFNGEITVRNRIEDDHSKGSNFIILFPAIE
ncbi:MAG: ATP-binding protein [Promethearchaeati archaeon]